MFDVGQPIPIPKKKRPAAPRKDSQSSWPSHVIHSWTMSNAEVLNAKAWSFPRPFLRPSVAKEFLGVVTPRPISIRFQLVLWRVSFEMGKQVKTICGAKTSSKAAKLAIQKRIANLKNKLKDVERKKTRVIFSRYQSITSALFGVVPCV